MYIQDPEFDAPHLGRMDRDEGFYFLGPPHYHVRVTWQSTPPVVGEQLQYFLDPPFIIQVPEPYRRPRFTHGIYQIPLRFADPLNLEVRRGSTLCDCRNTRPAACEVS